MTFLFSKSVAAAQAEGRPIVALESTIITHGMPFPKNVETALAVEAAVRDEGAEPATIAVLDGVPHIGLDNETITKLGQAEGVYKLSRADLAFQMAMGATGSTTVAATMILAARAGISVFATGGIGGVHRGAEDSYDISADLTELAETPVTVVCAGPKAILDIPKTMEVLETLGVPVIGYQTDKVPAFWSRTSALEAPMRADTPAQIAKAMATRAALGLPGGQLILNPIPQEAEIPPEAINPIIQDALSAAAQDGITGKAVTPYLLGEVLKRTDGASLKANIALIVSNARLAAQIAREIDPIS